MKSTFSIIATPIGNLKDITLRALEVLKNTEIIACEDTRMTMKLLSAHGIDMSGKKLLSYHAHSKLARVDQIISFLKEGKDVALVSDAGTPGISDPGAELVARIQEEFGAGSLGDGSGSEYVHQSVKKVDTLAEVHIEAIPGPSALTAALSIAGVPCADFTFLGFLPHKKGRETLFKEIATSERTMVFYESPHRIMKTLGSLEDHLQEEGNKERRKNGKKVTVCRELTKVFEEVVSGTASEVKTYFEKNTDKVRGEFVVIVSEK